MNCERCEQPATLHITEACEHALFEEHHLCEACGRQYLQEDGTRGAPDARPRGPHTELGEYRLEVVRVIVTELDAQQLLVFREVGGPRSFPLIIGFFEAVTIDRQLKGERYPRPLTHDGWFSTVTALGGELQAVGIDRREDQTYFASLRLTRPDGTEVCVDARPSDAVAMALTARVPILIPKELFAAFAE